MPGIDAMRYIGTRHGSEFEDPRTIRNPYHLALADANEDLRLRRARADRAEYQADPERQRIDAIRAQQDEDYDTEYRKPRRVEMIGDLERAEKRRDLESEAEGQFDPWRRYARNELENEKLRRLEAQYGRSADARMYEADRRAQGQIGAADRRATGQVESSRVNQMGRVRGQMVDEFGNVSPQNQPRVDQIDRNLGVMDGEPFPASRLKEFADAKFGGDIAAAEEHLAANGFYLDEDR